MHTALRGQFHLPVYKLNGVKYENGAPNAVSAYAQVMLNASNIICGYKADRKVSFIPYIGWALRALNKCPRALALHLPVFHHTRAMQYAVGMKMTFGQYIRCGERGYTLDRWVSTRFGIRSKDDSLPKRLTDEAQDPGDPKTRVPLEKMKKTYYRARGWDADGVPTQRTLKKLGIL